MQPNTDTVHHTHCTPPLQSRLCYRHRLGVGQGAWSTREGVAIGMHYVGTVS